LIQLSTKLLNIVTEFQNFMPLAYKSVLYLVPIPINQADVHWSIPQKVIEKIQSIPCFIVENAKTARHYLKRVHPGIVWDKVHIEEMDKHNMAQQMNTFKTLFKTYPEIGLMSEAGLPCIADPGNSIVQLAHAQQVRVSPLTGPSSIVLALIASGLNGQSFKFNGYLPSKTEEKRKQLLLLEKQCIHTTQLFIEAPYRNEQMLKDLIQMLQANTKLLIAFDIGGEQEMIICQPVQWYRNNTIQLSKTPCMFGIGN
jgi:16S rRNA (cytidine1402-2'-O)-methyltransferase